MVLRSALIALLLGLTACGSVSKPEQTATTQSKATHTAAPHASTTVDAAACALENLSASAGSPVPTHNGLIAFAANLRRPRATDIDQPPNSIYTVHADGTGMRRLAVNGSNPMWSPDGKQLLFNRQNTRTNSSQLWAMDGDGSHQRCIRPLGPAYASASWSPDGTRIAGPADKGIWIVDLRTHEQHTIPWATRGWYPPEDVRWSADGTALAAASVGKGPGPDDYTSDYAVFLVDPAGRTQHVEGPRDLLGFDWSWANGRLVYGSGLNTRGGECNGDLYTADPRGGGAHPLAALPCRQDWPTWSPDGQRVAFQSDGGLWVVNGDGSSPHELLANRFGWDIEGAGGPLTPSWQPVA